MSVGLSLLRSLIENGARSEFRQTSAELFLPDELHAFEFVSNFYRRHGQLPTLEACQENGVLLPAASNPPTYYLDRLRNRAIYNSIMTELPGLNEALRDRSRMDVAVEILQRATQVSTRFNTQNPVRTLHETMTDVMEDYWLAHQNPGIQGITLGCPYLDELTGGAEAGDVVTFVARPNVGKSWTVLNGAYRAWLRGASVLMVSMEMTDKQMARRMLGLHAGVNPDYLRRGQLSEFGREIVVERMQNVVNGAPFHLISGQLDQSVPVVDAAIQEFSPDLVVIDASYLMTPSQRSKNASQHEVLAKVGAEIKAMALARAKPIVQTVQFNREANRAKQKDLAHIGGTDVVGQISTIVVSIEPGEAPNEEVQRKYTLLKNREGDKGHTYSTHWQFNPPNFGFIPPDDHENAYDDAWQPAA